MKRPLYLLLVATTLSACSPKAGEQITMLVGTYTYDGSHGIYSYCFNQQTGQALLLDSLAIRNPSYLTVSDDGQTVYAVSETNDADASLTIIRLQDEGIAIFSVDNGTGLLTRIGYQPTAAHPRQFRITPNGQYLLCCCRDSDKIQVFRRDPQSGLLTDTHQDILLSHPVCAGFTPDK